MLFTPQISGDDILGIGCIVLLQLHHSDIHILNMIHPVRSFCKPVAHVLLDVAPEVETNALP